MKLTVFNRCYRRPRSLHLRKHGRAISGHFFHVHYLLP